MTRILVTGASGLLGLNFGLHTAAQHQVTGVVNRHPLRGAGFNMLAADLQQPGAAARLLDQTRPEVVLHCAAWANIDECEAQPERAEDINARLPGELASLCAQRGIYLLHISTDAVFDGLRGDYREEDEPSPMSVYARTKLQGEQAVLAANPAAGVARVNFYGFSLSGSRSLAEFFINNLSAGREVKGFTDVFFKPLQVTDLADVLLKMMDQRLGGVYHVLSSETLSKYDFGFRIAQMFGYDESLIQPVSWKDGGLKAARSPNLTLRTDKLAAALGAPPPTVEHGLQRLFDEYILGLPWRIRSLAVEG